MKRPVLIALLAAGVVALAAGGYALAAAPGGSGSASDDVVVRSSTVTVPAAGGSRFAKSSFSVACAAGETAIGGGFRAARSIVLLAGSYPDGASRWVLALANAGPRRTQATVYAICRRNTGGSTTGTSSGGTTGGTTDDGTTGGGRPAAERPGGRRATESTQAGPRTPVSCGFAATPVPQSDSEGNQ